MTDDRLRAVEQGQERLQTLLQESIRHQRETNERLAHICERHAAFIDGNGTPGAKIRIDRIEQTEKRNRWWMRALTVPVLGMLLAKIVTALGQ